MKAKFLITLCLSLSLFYISIQYDRCENDEYIRPVFSKKCIPCDSNSTNETTTTTLRFLSTKFKNVTYGVGNESNSCIEVDECPAGYFSINPTGECIEKCPFRFYSFNKVCFEKCPDNTMEVEPGSSVCKCLYKNYTDGTNLYCLGENQNCPSDHPFYDPVKRECSKTKCSAKSRMKIDNNTNTTYFECIPACQGDEYEYTYLDYKLCVKECPDHTFTNVSDRTCKTGNCSNYYDIKHNKCYDTINKCPKYTYDVNDNYHICVDDCESGAPFKDEAGKKCYTSCPTTAPLSFQGDGKSICIDKCSKLPFAQFETLDKTCRKECPGYYNITGDGEKHCLDTREHYVISNNTYQVFDKEQCRGLLFVDDVEGVNPPIHLCATSNCSLVSDKPFYNYAAPPEGPFCVRCDNTTDVAIIVGEEKYCNSKGECPVSYPFKLYNGKECFNVNSCSEILGGNFIYTTLNNPHICYDTCTNVIINSTYKWQSGNLITSDKNCIIDTKCPKEYPYHHEYTCYKDGCPKNTVMNITFEGTAKEKYIRCIPEIQCVAAGFTYVQDGTCINACDTFRYPYVINTTTTPLVLPGFCYKSFSQCEQKGYYKKYKDDALNVTKCVKSCKDIAGTYYSIISTDKELNSTCVLKCPNGTFLFDGACHENKCPKSLKGTALFLDMVSGSSNYGNCIQESECTGKIYDGEIKKCISKCDDTDMPYLDEAGKRCLKECPDGKYIKSGQCVALCTSMYYHPITKECADNTNKCQGFTKEYNTYKNISKEPEYKFTPVSSTEQQECASECPPSYYYLEKDFICIARDSCKYPSKTDTKVCLKLCEVGDFYNSINKVCVTKCEDGEFNYLSCEGMEDLKRNVRVCTSSCSNLPATKYFGVGQTGTEPKPIDITYKYALSSTKSCVKNCIPNENFLYKDICYPTCPKNAPYYRKVDEDNVKFYRCYEKCEEGYSAYIEGTKECLDKCPIDMKYIVYGKTECLKKCPEGYIISKSDGSLGLDTGYKICNKTCEEGKVNENGICKISCNQDSGSKFKYYLPETNTCLQNCPKNFYAKKDTDKNFKCVSSCDGYIDEDNYCYAQLTECPEKMNYITLDKKCKKTCGANEKILKVGEIAGNIYYQCLPTCKDYFRLDDYENKTEECYNTCPSGYYTSLSINSNNEKYCYRKCNKDPTYKYSVKDPEKTPTTFCAKFCPSNFPYYNNDFECVKTCSSTTEKIIDHDGRCVNNCTHFPFIHMLQSGSEKKCVEFCPKFIDANGNCVDQCGSNYTFIRNGNQCATSCDKNSIYKFAVLVSGTKTYMCSRSCPADQYFYEDDFICKIGCTDYVVEGTHICRKNCTQFNYALKDYEGYNYFYITSTEKQCVRNCKTKDHPFTYSFNNTCIKNCSETPYIYFYENDQVCLPNCSYYWKNGSTSNKELPFAPAKDTATNKYIGEKCLNDCPLGKYKASNNSCMDTCTGEEFGYIYFNKTDRVCQRECNPGQYHYDHNETIGTATVTLHECVDLCPTNNTVPANNKPYLLNNTCVASCISDFNGQDKKFFIYEFKHGENDTSTGNKTQKVCLTDCPEEYKYYVNNDTTNYSQCMAQCPATHPKIFEYPDLAGNITRIECRKTCSNSTIETIYSTTKEFDARFTNGTHCFTKCPKDFPYYKNEDLDSKLQDIECFKGQCPKDYYNYPGEYKCYKNCKKDEATTYDGKVDFNTKTCVTDCDYKKKVWQNGEVYFCVDNCTKDNAEYETPEGKCVKDCSFTVSGVENLIADPKNKLCLCQNKYYLDSTGTRKCLNPDRNDCYQTHSDSLKYPYTSSKDPRQCLNYCNNILSLDYDCLDDTVKNCNSFPNTELKILTDEDGHAYRKCECTYGKYKDDLGKYKCLAKGDKCPTGYDYIRPEKKECIKGSCPEGTTAFNEYCLEKNNPTSTNTWFTPSLFEVKFTESNEKCTKDYPFLISNRNKQCVKDCKYHSTTDPDYNSYTNDYSFLKGNQCVKECTATDGYTTKILQVEDSELKVYANSACECNHTWYLDKTTLNGIVCSNKDVKSCQQLEGCPYKYYLPTNKQCVNKCPDGYYEFNFVCYKECKEANPPGVTLKENTVNKTCECPGLMKKRYNNVTLIFEDICLPGTVCREENETTTEYVIVDNQCIVGTKCPSDHPLKFNGKCYIQCSDASNRTSRGGLISDDCMCQNLWYSLPDTKDDKHCIDSTIVNCTQTSIGKIYQKVDTNECVEKCPDGYYSFNYKCYKDKCPIGLYTKEEGSSKVCVCDAKYGVWWKGDQDIGGITRSFLFCGQGTNCGESANEDKVDNPYMTPEKQCVYSCDITTKFKFRSGKSCYESCPSKTTPIGGNQCNYDFTSFQNLTDLENGVNQDLLTIAETILDGGLMVAHPDATLQIYKINIDNKNSVEYAKKNNLTAIDLSKCLEKIYTSNGMPRSEKIIVTKYDLHINGSVNPGYMINTVEYNFFRENGAKIDMSVCQDTQFEITYPIKYYFDNRDKEYNATQRQQLKDLFELGRELYSENKDVDIFNYESKVYNDICVPLSINGKDITMEDRRTLLFPNVTLCENNCTPAYVDYNNVRVHCLCPVKLFVDFNREHYPANYKFPENETKAIQRGPTNLPVAKCISNLSKDTKNAIKESVGFYFVIVVMALEVALVFVTIFVNYRRVSKNLANKFDVEGKINFDDNFSILTQDAELFNKMNKDTENDKAGQPSSQRNLNNPPKKRDGEEDEEEEDNEGNNDLITVKKVEGAKDKENDGNDGNDEKNEKEEEEEEEESEPDNKADKDIVFEEEKTLVERLVEEQRLLNREYEDARRKDHSHVAFMILTEMLDKIYLSKTLLFYGKYDLFGLLLGLYFLYHLLLLTLMMLFFNIKTISKIYTEENFPDVGFYLLYGFIAMLILWVVYKTAVCLCKNTQLVEWEVQENRVEKAKGINRKGTSKDRMDRVLSIIKRKMIAFFIIELVLIIFCFVYICSFCAVYVGTRKYAFWSYGIALTEIAVIKIFYSIVLAVLRKISLWKKLKTLYKVVTTFHIYFD